MKKTSSSWCLWLCILVCLGTVVLITSVTLIATASSSPKSTVGDDNQDGIHDCVDLDESNDAACNLGEDEEGPLPSLGEEAVVTIQAYEDGLIYKGVALAGGEIDDAGDGFFVPDDNDAQLFLYRKLNTYRIPFLWENFAFRDGTIRSNAYVTKLGTLIASLLEQRASVVLVLYNYMVYGPNRQTILVGNEAPRLDDVIRLWRNIARRYTLPRMIFGIMNEGGAADTQTRTAYSRAALEGIRTGEREFGIQPRLVHLFGTASNHLLSWFNTVNAETLTVVNDPGDNYALVVYQYFDADFSGQYRNGDCITLQRFREQFDFVFPNLVIWSRNNNKTVVVAEFGAPDTANCRETVGYFLSEVRRNPYIAGEGGFAGWILWAGGKRWNGAIPISLSPSGLANRLLWDNRLYERFVKSDPKQIPTFRELLRRAIKITNNSPQRFIYLDGYVPYLFKGSANIEPNGGVFYLYSNINRNTPTTTLRIRYFPQNNNNTVLAIGLFQTEPPIFSVEYNIQNRDVTPPRYNLGVSDPEQCDIAPAGPNSLRGEPRCFTIVVV